MNESEENKQHSELGSLATTTKKKSNGTAKKEEEFIKTKNSHDEGLSIAPSMIEVMLQTVEKISKIEKTVNEMGEKIGKLQAKNKEFEKEIGTSKSENEVYELDDTDGFSLSDIDMDMNKHKKEIKNEFALMNKIMEVIKLAGKTVSNEIGRNLGDKMFEMNTAIDQLKTFQHQVVLKQQEAIHAAQNQQIEKENMKQISEKCLEKLTKMDAKVAERDSTIQGLNEKMAHMNKSIDLLKAENEEKDRTINEFKEELAQLININREFGEQQKTSKEAIANLSKLVAEINVYIGCDFSIEFKNNQWSEVDCGLKLSLYANRLAVKHSGPLGPSGVRARLPIPYFNQKAQKPYVAAYFEVEISEKKVFLN